MGLRMVIAVRYRKARRAAGLSVQQAAKLSKFEAKDIEAIENGIAANTDETWFEVFSELYDVSEEYLMGSDLSEQTHLRFGDLLEKAHNVIGEPDLTSLFDILEMLPE